MEMIKSLFENSFFQNVLSGTIGGFVVYLVQKLSDKSAKSKENISNSIVGKKELKILSEDFLYQYEPHKITVEKIIEEFGKPIKIFKAENNCKSNVFEFRNAKVEIFEDLEYNSITSITVFSKLDKKFPVKCRVSFEDDERILGNAKISDVIIKDCFFFESYNTPLGYETIIGCLNAYRQTKHLKYFYQIDGQFKSVEETKGEIIKQVCVTQLESIHPFFSYYDTFYE
ncbi:hypothetical protein DBB36_03785 [Flavobacterium sp. WLB]|uniref:hypothetical protein n=1 Tax=unclassified Flavobacterium TaxID=196869 RepID=UPI0006ABA74D|nr:MULTISPECIES: hypothetical protein [unclassified Flavobacterium]KOP36542.1 hypothetical protein AKO67_19175 [Flavobacterium sp. VMW]OWU92040.1 hypothetical protein APR43_05315 [Flavobacterium sp. NLM]PUU71348.1 hypothetical protein DBB36_03785 [Flavobacterium sp. WLB]